MISFYPTGVERDGWHTLKVRLKGGGDVRARLAGGGEQQRLEHRPAVAGAHLLQHLPGRQLRRRLPQFLEPLEQFAGPLEVLHLVGRVTLLGKDNEVIAHLGDDSERMQTDKRAIRGRLSASFRYFISQRLIPKKEGGRVAVLEILKSTLRTRDYMEGGEGEGKTLLDAMRDGEMDGMQYFDGEIEKLVRAGVITSTTGLAHATNAGNLRLLIADVMDEEDVEDGALVHY